jgi:hypothetical protein
MQQNFGDFFSAQESRSSVSNCAAVRLTDRTLVLGGKRKNFYHIEVRDRLSGTFVYIVQDAADILAGAA